MSDTNYELQVSARPCTLFEDAENAISVNEGVTLIPWMGDKDTMIDRYDVRGHLYTESEFGMRKSDDDVDPEEVGLIEQIDKERYMFLTVDELEFEAYLEEEEKRFNSKKGGRQIGFSYGNSAAIEAVEKPKSSISEEVYVPSKELMVPDGMPVPKTDKHYKIIEKTASFLSTQTLQTEILIRTKQKDNAQFQFLELDNELNPFYKHMVRAIKRGIVKVKQEPKVIPSVPAKPVTVPTKAVVPTVQLPPAPQPAPTVTQQPAPRGLWNNLSGVTQHIVHSKKGMGCSLAALSAYGAASDDEDSSSDEETAPNNNTPLNNMINNMSKPIPVPPGTSPEVIQYLIMSGFVALPPPAPGLPQLLVPPSGQEGFSLPTSVPPPPPPPDEQVQVTPQHDYDSSEEQRPLSPSPEQKGIITKLAEYVVKNGDSFEKKVLQKQDQRFKFVNPNDEHHEYYQYLIQKFRNKRVKLNVAPITLKKSNNTLNRPPVDNTVFNQSSSEEEDEENEEENEEDKTSQQPSPGEQTEAFLQNNIPSPSPEGPFTQESNDGYDPTESEILEHGVTDEVPKDVTSPVHEVAVSEVTEPHPLDSDAEPEEDSGMYDVQEMITSPNHNGSQNDLSPSKTPVYTQQDELTPSRTPSPNPSLTPEPHKTPSLEHACTPDHNRECKTPDIRSPSQSPTSSQFDSDADSVDSETKGKPLIQHFSDGSESEKKTDTLAERYDLDNRRTKSRSISSKSPLTPATKTRSPSPRSPTPKIRSRSSTPKISPKEKKSDKKCSKPEGKKEEKVVEEPEEGELSDHSTKKRSKHKKQRDRRNSSSSKSPDRRKNKQKKKKSKSKKREKSSDDSDHGRSSSKRLKCSNQSDRKRKRTLPPSTKKSETEEWISEKMKKLSKIELLKEIENKIEEKRKQKDHEYRAEKKSKDHSDTESLGRTKEKLSKDDKKIAIEKELEEIDRKLKMKKTKSSDTTSKEKLSKEVGKRPVKHKVEDTSQIKSKNKNTGSKDKSTKEKNKSEDYKKLALQLELEAIEKQLQNKKIKKQKITEKDIDKKKNKSSTQKINGHSDKSKKKKSKDTRESSKSKKT